MKDITTAPIPHRNSWQGMQARQEAEAVKGSTAEAHDISAKGAEAVIRADVSKRGVTTDKCARAAGRADGYAINPFTGKRGPFEVKTGGTVNYDDPGDEWTADDILPGLDRTPIYFPVMTRITCYEDVPMWTAILTRADFIRYAEAASRNGIRGTFHRTSPGTKGRPRVLAFQPTPLNKMREAIAHDIEAGILYTLDAYMLEHNCPGVSL